MSWRIIFISSSERISLHLNSLVVKKDDGGEIDIPLCDIDSIVLEDYRTTITTRLLNKLIEYHINFIICDEKFNPNGTFMPLNNHFRQHKVVTNQINWCNEKKKYFWSEIIQKKLINQGEILKKINKPEEAKKLLNYSKSVLNDDISNREGHGAKEYFKALFDDNFIRRKEDVINSGLNYGYTIFHSKIARVISAKGLLTYLGIHHKNEYNQYNLASDIIEIFRPIIDFWVFENLFERNYFSKNDRIQLINLLNARILVNGRKETVAKAMEFMVDKTISFFDDGVCDSDKWPSLEKIDYYEL